MASRDILTGTPAGEACDFDQEAATEELLPTAAAAAGRSPPVCLWRALALCAAAAACLAAGACTARQPRHSQAEPAQGGPALGAASTQLLGIPDLLRGLPWLPSPGAKTSVDSVSIVNGVRASSVVNGVPILMGDSLAGDAGVETSLHAWIVKLPGHWSTDAVRHFCHSAKGRSACMFHGNPSKRGIRRNAKRVVFTPVALRQHDMSLLCSGSGSSRICDLRFSQMSAPLSSAPAWHSRHGLRRAAPDARGSARGPAM